MRKLFRYLKPYWHYAIISPLLMILEVTADLCLPYLMSFIVNYGIVGDTIAENRFAYTVMNLLFGEGNYRSWHIILTFGVMMLLVTLIGGFFGTFCAYTAAKASQGFGHDLRKAAYQKVMSLSIEQTDQFTTGSLVTRMTNDIAMIVEFMEMILRMFVRAPFFMIGGTFFLLSLDIKFGVVLLAALPLLIITLILVLTRAVPLFSTVQKRLDRVNCVVQENVSGARVVKAYVREDYECERFRDANGELRNVNYRVQRLMAIIHPVLVVVQNLAVIAIIWLGGKTIAQGLGGMSTGNIMAAVTYTIQVVSSIMMITMMFQSVSRALASAKRVREVVDCDPVIQSGEKSADPAPVAVAFRNVTFRYPGTVGSPVLRNIHLEIKKGETLAIVGATGSGKSSLVRMLPRFYDATEGEVMIDGLSVREYDLTKLRQKIAFVLQKSELFSDTVANNIRWGKKDATDDEVRKAAQIAQADEFIQGFSEGYETFVAEKGASLSGGQKQRLSIARALVRRPEILILDDATSALDLATEARLRKALNEAMADTTVILIAQRIASVREADRIAVIENGTIKACAPHDELMQSCDTYREIYASQIERGGAANG
ncbi:MAG: ABC transporter ATP-binding protein [Ruminococcaceae bacterium]|nr:ABC transporter ATP-binding protein [Oscillospiraceae bacterium]